MSSIHETELKTLGNQNNLKEEKLNLPQDIGINPQSRRSESQANQQGVYDQLNQIFSEQDKEKKAVYEAREILGESASSLSDEQVYDLVNEVQYLTDTWLEEFEQKVFDGKTLKEILEIDI